MPSSRHLALRPLRSAIPAMAPAAAAVSLADLPPELLEMVARELLDNPWKCRVAPLTIGSGRKAAKGARAAFSAMQKAVDSCITALHVTTAITRPPSAPFFPNLTFLSLCGLTVPPLPPLPKLSKFSLTGSIVGVQAIEYVASHPSVSKFQMAECTADAAVSSPALAAAFGRLPRRVFLSVLFKERAPGAAQTAFARAAAAGVAASAAGARLHVGSYSAALGDGGWTPEELGGVEFFSAPEVAVGRLALIRARGAVIVDRVVSPPASWGRPPGPIVLCLGKPMVFPTIHPVWMRYAISKGMKIAPSRHGWEASVLQAPNVDGLLADIAWGIAAGARFRSVVVLSTSRPPRDGPLDIALPLRYKLWLGPAYRVQAGPAAIEQAFGPVLRAGVRVVIAAGTSVSDEARRDLEAAAAAAGAPAPEFERGEGEEAP